jgi:hypothetical protein
LAARTGNVKAGLSVRASQATKRWMSDIPAKPTRDERLAAKLRENLQRRKAQSRLLEPKGATEPKGDSPDLPKPPATR